MSFFPLRLAFLTAWHHWSVTVNMRCQTVVFCLQWEIHSSAGGRDLTSLLSLPFQCVNKNLCFSSNGVKEPSLHRQTQQNRQKEIDRCTLWSNLRVFISKLEKRLMNYSSLISTSPLFQETISNWTVDSKAVSCFRTFVISTSIKQVKGLELILSVPFAFGSCCCEPTSCGQRILTTWIIQLKQTIVRLQKQNKSIREIAGTFRVAISTFWYILRKKKNALAT